MRMGRSGVGRWGGLFLERGALRVGVWVWGGGGRGGRGVRGLGSGEWGLGVGGWGLGIREWTIGWGVGLGIGRDDWGHWAKIEKDFDEDFFFRTLEWDDDGSFVCSFIRSES